MFKFQMFDVVVDKVTGFTGVILVRCEYATGCRHYGICPQATTKEGKNPDWEYIDESRLEYVKGFEPFKSASPIDPSGPTSNPPQW